MAGTPLQSQYPSETLNLSEQWEIQYSRFFNFPSPPSTCLGLRPLPRAEKVRCGGTWLTLYSMGSVNLITDHKTQRGVLIVSSSRNIYWEHYISNLHFCCSHVSYISECPRRGSRVVLASYRDSLGQIQKFVMCFSASSDSQDFMHILKESFKDTRNVELQNRGVDLESSSPAHCISQEKIYYRDCMDLTYLDPRGTSPLEQPYLNCEDTEYPRSQETVIPNDLENMSQTLPSSLIQRLSDSSAEAEQEILEVPEEVNFKKRLLEYMATSSFHDMLSGLERVIDELGGDLSVH